jgi:hypothetical protein
MTIEIKGEIKLIGELQTFDSGFTKQQLVVTEPGQYPNDIPIDFLKDKADYLQNFNVGDSVVVNANVKGSEYNGKYYVGLTAWTIKKDVDANSQPANTNSQPQQPYNTFVDKPKEPIAEEDSSDLPF